MRLRYTGLCVAFVLAAGLGTNVVAQENASERQKQIEAARAADTAGDGREAVRLWTPLAEQGLPEAQMALGIAYTYGARVCKNQSLALSWLTRAADQGDIKAYYFLGKLYDDGTGAFNDKARAVAWYQKAAEAGDAGSAEALSYLYGKGEGVPKDDALTYSWMKTAAELRRRDGDMMRASLDAFIVGHMYAGDKDYANAEAWYLRAANEGSLEAQDELAPMYEKGEVVAKDYVAAYKWYALLAAYDKKAGEVEGTYKVEVAALKRLSAKMTPAQRREARKQVAEANIPDLTPMRPQISPAVAHGKCPAP